MKSYFSVCLFFCVLWTADAKLKVVATTPDLASLASEIAGKDLDLTLLCKPKEDPHFVDARPSFIVKLNQADVLVAGGADLEAGYLPTLLQGARNRKILPGAIGYCSGANGIALLEVPTSLDRSQGDVHAKGNPHYLMDPENAKITAQNICNTFCKVDPSHCDTYRKNLLAFQQLLTARIIQWRSQLQPFAGRKIVSYHNSWPYFANRFNVDITLFLEPKPGIPPTPGHLGKVISEMKQQNIKTIFAEPYVNRRTAENIATRTGATVLDVSHFPGAIKGTELGYVSLLDYLVRSTVMAFQKAQAP